MNRREARARVYAERRIRPDWIARLTATVLTHTKHNRSDESARPQTAKPETRGRMFAPGSSSSGRLRQVLDSADGGSFPALLLRGRPASCAASAAARRLAEVTDGREHGHEHDSAGAEEEEHQQRACSEAPGRNLKTAANAASQTRLIPV